MTDPIRSAQIMNDEPDLLNPDGTCHYHAGYLCHYHTLPHNCIGENICAYVAMAKKEEA